MIADLILCSLWTLLAIDPPLRSQRLWGSTPKRALGISAFLRACWDAVKSSVRSRGLEWAADQQAAFCQMWDVSPAIRCHHWQSPLGRKSSLTLLSLWVGAPTAAKVSSKCVSRQSLLWVDWWSFPGWRRGTLTCAHCPILLGENSYKAAQLWMLQGGYKLPVCDDSEQCLCVLVSALVVFLKHWLSNPRDTEAIMQSLPSCFCARFFGVFSALCLSKALFGQVQQKCIPLFPQWSSVRKGTTDQAPCFIAPQHTNHVA